MREVLKALIIGGGSLIGLTSLGTSAQAQYYGYPQPYGGYYGYQQPAPNYLPMPGGYPQPAPAYQQPYPGGYYQQPGYGNQGGWQAPVIDHAIRQTRRTWDTARRESTYEGTYGALQGYGASWDAIQEHGWRGGPNSVVNEVLGGLGL
jgi:hypothetical protein